MMTTEQRYLFDVTGYLHLRKAISEKDLALAQQAANNYINSSQDDLSSDFGSTDGRLYENGFAFHK